METEKQSNKITMNRIIMDYILFHGKTESKALMVSEVIIGMLRSGELKKENIQSEIDKSKIFIDYDSLKEFRKQVRGDILDIVRELDIKDIAHMVANASTIDQALSKFFTALDTNPRYIKFYRKEFIEHERGNEVQ